MTLREKLIVLRDKAGLSQMSLAHQLDVSRQAVSPLGKWRYYAVHGQAEGAGEDLRCIPRLAVQ